MQEISLKIDSSVGESLATRVDTSEGTNSFVLFLHGGATDVGKDRFMGWQEQLAEDGIGSVAFDFVGVGESPGDMTQESLAKRVADAACVAEWMKATYPDCTYYLCGVSMGGYVALSLVDQMPDMFSKLIIQVPAAYSSAAHDLKFDLTFSEELRRPGSWKDSPSFGWWKNFAGEKMLLACEKDLTIPREIIDRYRAIGEDSDTFVYKELAGAPHNIWKAVEDKERILAEAYDAVLDFLK